MKPASIRMRHLLPLVNTIRSSRLASLPQPLRWLLACSLLAFVGIAQAANVTGTISSNTTWTTSQSPYVLQGEVVVDNNAMLTIQAGVQVRMAAGASFTLKQGALQAVGTASSPIVITSDAATPKPGDWRQWRLTAGTQSAQTVLDYVQMSYGSGLVVESSAPVLNNLTLQNHSGPAISIDLAASPTGRNLKATGNALNAISVPSGTIRGQVVWGLVGIPYLVQQGIVQVGQSPLSLEPTRLKLSPGVVAILRLAVSAPAPAGGLGIDLTSSVPSVATVASRSTVPAGQYGADVEVQARAVGTTSITASHATLGSAAAFVEVVNLPALELAPAAPTIGVQRPAVMSVRAPQASPAGGLTVTLGNSDNTVLRAPASVLIPAGQQIASFEVTGLAEGASRLSAQAEGFATGLSTVTVRGKALVLPSSIVVAPGAHTQSTVQLTEPAPAGGLTVNLATAASGTATVPASVNVPAGASQASFSVSGVALGTTQLTASASGYQGTQTTVRVDAISIDLEPVGDLVLSVDQSLSRRVQLSKAAPAGGVTVKVAIENTATASVTPADVFVPEGQVFGLVPLTIKGLAVAQTKLNLTALGLIGRTANVNVAEKIRLQLVTTGNRPKVTAGKGLWGFLNEMQVQRLINGQAAGGAEPLTVTLKCVNEAICKVPSSVTIPANQSYAYVPVGGLEIGSTQIEATAAGATASAPMPVEVIAPQVIFGYLDGTRNTVSARDDFRVNLRVPGAWWPDSVYPVQPLTLNLSVPDQSPAGVVGGIYNRAGALISQVVLGTDTSYTDWLYVAQPAQAGTYRVGVDIPGVVSARSEVQTVTAGSQALQLVTTGNRPKVTAGKGLWGFLNEMQVQRLINGQAAGGAEPLTVTLKCVNEAICKVPSSVTIPANQSYAYVPVGGLEIGSTQIEATAAGATASAPMPVEVIAPQVIFGYLDGTRNTVSARDDFRVNLRVPGAWWPDSVYPVQPLTLNLSVPDQSPAGVVGGIYNRAGALISQVVLGTDTSYTDWLYVAQPAQAGTYRVGVDIPGVVSARSEVQTVTAADQGLRLRQVNGSPKVVVGKGMNSFAPELVLQRLVNGEVASGADAVQVNLRCVNESICKAPATVTIPAGGYQVTVPITGVDVGSTQIEASASGFSQGAITIETVVPNWVFVSGLPNALQVGQSYRDVRVYAEVPGANYSGSYLSPAQPITVTFTSSVPSTATVGATGMWRAGSWLSDGVVLNAIAPGTTTITASAPGFNPVTSGVITVNP
ncbi:hypothetical protein [Ottowia testudinis]|uniref:Uncharacterized protein n=1 Tax=Ottowia testudinis TaxID=2816950 RepID=A0A975CMT4_9BURK|nr:hypothetical protein [Ottowia testudinis]QTD46378.1 hypothetical protein J1M35_05670 [Ottowia testudinis]